MAVQTFEKPILQMSSIDLIKVAEWICDKWIAVMFAEADCWVIHGKPEIITTLIWLDEIYIANQSDLLTMVKVVSLDLQGYLYNIVQVVGKSFEKKDISLWINELKVLDVV